MPAGAALVELAKYATFKFQATGQESRWGAERYVAFVMHSDADAGVVWIDLGEAAPIDELVAELGDRIEDANRASELADWAALEDEYRESAQSLNEKLFAPIAAKLGDVKRIYLAPDGQLHNLPFEALVDGDNKYLVEQGYTFAYLTSGRDLVRSRQYEPGQGAYVFAAPNYNLPHDARYQLANHAPTAAPSNEAKTPPINALAAAGPRGTRSGDIRGLKWQVLAGMEPEGAEAANQLADGPYGDVKRYTGDAALEENFKQLSRPRLVVLITHGYFLPDQPFYREDDLLDDSAMRGSFAQGIGLARLRAQENPLYRSGVVLAGANTLDDPVPAGISVDDGWLTAEEISQLDLRGTDLVVLSACNTNRGTVATGDAVAGLRSAFLFAGARTLVGSLYEVPDQETRELMRTFYARLRQGRGKLNSLNEARLDAIRQQRQSHGAAHPFFWASFVLVGEP
ncbi:MAG: CHAT domain-containing protein [Pirellulales bacterium]